MLGSSDPFVIDTAELNKKRFVDLIDYEDVGDILSVSLDLFEESDRGDKLDSALRIVQVNALEQDVTVAFKSSVAHQERFNCETFDGDCTSCTTLDGTPKKLATSTIINIYSVMRLVSKHV